MVCAFVPVAFAFGAVQQNLAPYAADHGFDTKATAYLVSLMALVMIGAKVFFGAMADRWSHRASTACRPSSVIVVKPRPWARPSRSA